MSCTEKASNLLYHQKSSASQLIQKGLSLPVSFYGRHGGGAFDFDFEVACGQVWVDTRFAGVNYNNSEQFNTAGRSIGTGLMAIDLVSHWTWASVL